MIEWTLRKSGEVQLYGTFDNIGEKKQDIVQIRYSDYLEKLPCDQKNLYWGTYKTYLWLNDYPLIVIGPHWPFFLFAYTIFWIVCTCLVQFLLKEKNLSENQFVFSVFVCVVQLISYLMLFVKNPGVANQVTIELLDESIFQKLQRKPRAKDIWYCETCRLIQSPGTVHCVFCKVCISKSDHHCPWTGKCIGKKNIIEFYLFVVSTAVVFGLFISLTASPTKIIGQTSI